MLEVVDTNVIIYAVAHAPTQEHATKRRVARELLMKMDVVNVAVVSAFELEWARREDERLDEVVRGWNVLALDTAAKDHAVAIARRAISLGQMCRVLELPPASEAVRQVRLAWLAAAEDERHPHRRDPPRCRGDELLAAGKP